MRKCKCCAVRSISWDMMVYSGFGAKGLCYVQVVVLSDLG